MNRISFLKSILSQGLLVIPFIARARSKKPKKVLLLRRHVAGFQYGAGPQLIGKMKKGDELRLVSEPENKFDNKAIAVYWKQHKIGYVPAADNEIPDNILKQEVKLTARIENLDRNAEPWKVCEVGVWVD